MVRKYERIARDLRELISRGEYPPGSLLPPIPELMATYDVARDTVRDAVATLANEGLVTPRSGIGTVVREVTEVNLNSSLKTPHPTWDETAGESAQTVVKETEWAIADTEIGMRLKVDPGTEVVRRCKHYYKGRDVVLMHEQWIPGEIARKITEVSGYDWTDKKAKEPKDLYSLMRDAGYVPTESTEVVTCRMPDPNERDTMNMPPGVPVQLIMRITHNAEGKALETSNFSGCGDRTTQTYTVRIPHPETLH